MSTPTTVKFQIVVSSTDQNGLTTDKRYVVSLGLSVTSDGQDVGIEFGPALGDNTSQTPPSLPDQPLPPSVVMPPEDPPRLLTVIAN